MLSVVQSACLLQSTSLLQILSFSLSLSLVINAELKIQKMSGLTITQIVVLALACSAAWARPQPLAGEMSGAIRSGLENPDAADGRWFYQGGHDSSGTGARPSYTYDNAFPDQVNFQEHATLYGEPLFNQNYYAYQREDQQQPSPASTFDEITRAISDGIESVDFRSGSELNYSQSVETRSGDSVSASQLTASQSE